MLDLNGPLSFRSCHQVGILPAVLLLFAVNESTVFICFRSFSTSALRASCLFVSESRR